MIPEAISGLSGAIAIVRGLMTTATALDSAEVKAKLADVLSQLASAKVELTEAQDQIRDLQKKLDIRGKLAYDEASRAYWMQGDSDEEKTAYCVRCYDADGKLIHLKTVTDDDGTWMQCFSCGSIHTRQRC